MLSDKEKEYVRKLVQKELDNLKEESEDATISYVTPAFLKGEKEYEEFLRGILEKLK